MASHTAVVEVKLRTRILALQLWALGRLLRHAPRLGLGHYHVAMVPRRTRRRGCVEFSARLRRGPSPSGSTLHVTRPGA